MVKITLVRRKDSGNWEASFSWKGKRFRKSFKMKTYPHKYDALHGAFLWQQQIMSQGWEPFEEFAWDWLHNKVISTGARWKYSAAIAHLTEYFAGRTLAQTNNIEEIQYYLASKAKLGTLKISTINYDLYTLRMILKAAKRQEKISSNRAYLVSPLVDGAPDERRTPSVAEMQALIEASKSQGAMFANLIHLLVVTGLRIGEACGLKWEDVDFDNRRLFVRRTYNGAEFTAAKNRKLLLHNTLPLSGVAMHILKAQKASKSVDSEFIFCNSIGKALRYKNLLKREWKKTLETAGMEKRKGYGFHVLRHYFVSALIQNGATVKEAQALARHSNSQTTLDTYGHLFNHGLERAIGLIDRQLTQDCHKTEGYVAALKRNRP